MRVAIIDVQGAGLGHTVIKKIKGRVNRSTFVVQNLKVFVIG